MNYIYNLTTIGFEGSVERGVLGGFKGGVDGITGGAEGGAQVASGREEFGATSTIEYHEGIQNKVQPELSTDLSRRGVRASGTHSTLTLSVGRTSSAFYFVWWVCEQGCE